MPMNQVDEIAEKYSSRTADAKSKWYSPSAHDYDIGRPSYPEAVISEVLSKTNVSAKSTLIEIGSGPGTATQHFSGIGCSIHCVEPNPDFVRIAKQSFRNAPNVQIQQCTFEEHDHSSEPDSKRNYNFEEINVVRLSCFCRMGLLHKKRWFITHDIRR